MVSTKNLIDTQLDLDGATLDYLIAVKRESARLDYKLQCDLRRGEKDRIELVRDMLAMANTDDGGWIVVGVEEAKSPKGKSYVPRGMSALHQAQFDEARVRQLVEKYTDAIVDFDLALLASARHGMTFGLILARPAQEIPIVFAKDGQHTNGGVTETLFRQGDVYVRRGSSSIRANQNDWRNFKSRIRQRERERWTEETMGIRGLTDGLRDLIDLLKTEHASKPAPPTAADVVGPIEEFTKEFTKVLDE